VSERECRECGSKRLIPDVPIIDQNAMGESPGTLGLAVDGAPNAWIFKDRAHGQILADICGECGHVELYIPNADKLYRKYLKSKKPRP
jgi:hypothetical protein